MFSRHTALMGTWEGGLPGDGQGKQFVLASGARTGGHDVLGVFKRGRSNCKLLFKTFQVRRKDERMITRERNRTEGGKHFVIIFF